MAISADEKKYLIIAGVAVGGYLLYRYYENAAANTASSTAGTTASDAAGSDYAALAGQEQSDVASLQGQEQSDVQTLTQALGAESAQETSDVSTIEGQISNLTGTVSSLASTVAGFASNVAAAPAASSSSSGVAAAASGSSPTSRVGTITTHPGGAFYVYWQKVFGTPPPTTVAVNNPIYVAWQKGVPTKTAKASVAGSSLAAVKGGLA